MQTQTRITVFIHADDEITETVFDERALTLSQVLSRAENNLLKSIKMDQKEANDFIKDNLKCLKRRFLM